MQHRRTQNNNRFEFKTVSYSAGQLAVFRLPGAFLHFHLMGDKKDKEKGGTWNRLMSMKMLGGKASTGTARAAKEADGDINKRRSANITAGATVTAAERDSRRPGLSSDLFKAPGTP